VIDDLWYKNTVIYNVDLESFMDANGDGTGDFEGLMRRLDYVQSLGVGTIWLAPFQPTPNRDNGYDISDYYGVDPRHGSSGYFVEFMHQARKRGLKVIIDLVVNHTSIDHPWFQQARADPACRYRDWYIWSKRRPSNWRSGIVFPGAQTATWTYDRRAKAYYYHRFYEHQPDLNMDHPEVRREVERIMGYWLELGVSGFRVDAVPFVIETTVPGQEQGALHFEYLKEMRAFLQWRAGDAILLGEANVAPEETQRYFGTDGDGLQLIFNFYVNQFLWYALATGDTAPLVDALHATREHPPTAQWAQFLRNHDELDLGRLSPEQQAQVFARFGAEESMRLYDRGIRRRLAPMLGDRRRIELAYSLQFSLPGTPVLYYGDEIGMGDDLSLPERHAVRTPMQWAAEAQGGFSRAETTIHPVIDDGPFSFRRVNVEAQRRDPRSLLNWMARLIRLRHECPEIGWGDWKVLPTAAPQTLALCYEWRGTSVVVLHNFAETTQEVQLRPEVDGDEQLFDLLEESRSEADDRGAHHIVVDAYGYRWFRVGSLNYALHRTR
jgi:maltose alpha-D-glucosyltransferase / alpha-amylase